MNVSCEGARGLEKPGILASEMPLPSSKDATGNTSGTDEMTEGTTQPLDQATNDNATASTPTETEHEGISGIQLFVVLGSIASVTFMMLLDTSIIATAVPRITDDFHSLEDIGWYSSAYQLANATLQPLTGKIYSSFSSKWSFIVFFAVFELGSLLCGVATSSTMLIIGRAVAGMGSAGLMNGALTIIAGAVPLSKRAALMGILMGISQIGVICGPVVGGALTEYTTWRWCKLAPFFYSIYSFYINLPIGGVVAIFLLLSRIPDQIKKPNPRTILPQLHRKLDLVGFVLFAPAPIQLLLALQYGGQAYPWKSATVIGLFCGSAANFVVWGLWNYHKGDAALIPFSTAKKQAVWTSTVTQMLLFSNLLTLSYFIPIYFQTVKGASPVKGGVYFLPSILSQLVAAVLSGFLVGKMGYAIPWALASGVLGSVGSGLLSRLGPNSPAGEWIGFQIISGVGRGLGIQMPLLAVQAALAPAEVAIGISLLSFAQFMGTSIFITIANTIFSQILKTDLAKYAPHADAPAIIAAGGTAFRGLVKPEDLPGVLKAFAKGIDGTCYLATGMCVASFATAWGMGWIDIREKKKAVAGESKA